jgi:hypothetical protein
MPSVTLTSMILGVFTVNPFLFFGQISLSAQHTSKHFPEVLSGFAVGIVIYE